jgi:site-specific DNA-methyltransferase (adenine-specific)
MSYSNQFFKAIGIDPAVKSSIGSVSKKIGVPIERLKFYNETNTLPSGRDLEAINSVLGISELSLMLKMGRLDHSILEAIQNNSEEVLKIISSDCKIYKNQINVGDAELKFATALGKMYQGDCLAVMKMIKSDSVDLVFADPPFNLDKLYPSNMNDNIKIETYIKWSEAWIAECIRILKPGGSFFTWNLPLWNSKFSSFIHGRMNFRHWIATDIKYSLPIQGRLYPSHYSLLYFNKGSKPNYFNADRLPMQTCPKCFGDLKDYGGYKHKMNPLGINLTDVWYDIPPVRHAKYKNRGANELSIKLLDRIIEMASVEGDIVFDPFGGAGTTYIVAEIKGRKWIGSELGPVDIIENRLKNLKAEADHLEQYRDKYNTLFTEKVKVERDKRGLWTYESAQEKNSIKLRSINSKPFDD